MTRIPINQVELANQGLQDRLQMSTAEIGLAVRTTNCLEEKGIFTVHDLLHTKREDLLCISNFGEKTLEEVYKSLEGIGFFRSSTQDLQGQEMNSLAGSAQPGLAQQRPMVPR